MEEFETGDQNMARGDPRPEPRGLPSLAARLIQVVVSPGKLMTALKEEPRWAGALVLGAVLVLVAAALIPGDIWAESFRQTMLEAGGEVPVIPEGIDMGQIQRVLAPIAGVIFWFIFAFFVAAVATVIFAFLLGDQGTFRQYLSVTSHALLISALGGVLILPLRIAQRSPQVTLNLGLFTPFLERGYLLNFLTTLDIFLLWSYVIIGLGIHVMDRRRSWAGAAGVLLVLSTGLSALIALLIPT